MYWSCSGIINVREWKCSMQSVFCSVIIQMNNVCPVDPVIGLYSVPTSTCCIHHHKHPLSITRCAKKIFKGSRGFAFSWHPSWLHMLTLESSTVTRSGSSSNTCTVRDWVREEAVGQTPQKQELQWKHPSHSFHPPHHHVEARLRTHLPLSLFQVFEQVQSNDLKNVICWRDSLR